MQTDRYVFDMQVLLLPECGTWTAQGLDYDIVAQGKTKALALKEFLRTCVSQAIVDLELEYRPLQNCAPAPTFYWTVFRNPDEKQQRRRCQFTFVRKRSDSHHQVWYSTSPKQVWKSV